MKKIILIFLITFGITLSVFAREIPYVVTINNNSKYCVSGDLTGAPNFTIPPTSSITLNTTLKSTSMQSVVFGNLKYYYPGDNGSCSATTQTTSTSSIQAMIKSTNNPNEPIVKFQQYVANPSTLTGLEVTFNKTQTSYLPPFSSQVASASYETVVKVISIQSLLIEVKNP